MKILALIDDSFIAGNLREIICGKFAGEIELDCRFSYNLNHKETENYKPINIKNEIDRIISNYDLIFSLCSQIFPKKLVESVRCINFHFGILPGACGVAPITFSIINNIKPGVTIHLMDEKIDNGDIIYKEIVETSCMDTFKDLEIKCQNKLINILNEHITDLIYQRYKTEETKEKRKYFSLNDFKKICKIDLNEKITARKIIDKLRALEFGDGNKAYYVSDYGDIVNISIKLTKIGNINKND